MEAITFSQIRGLRYLAKQELKNELSIMQRVIRQSILFKVQQLLRRFPFETEKNPNIKQLKKIIDRRKAEFPIYIQIQKQVLKKITQETLTLQRFKLTLILAFIPLLLLGISVAYSTSGKDTLDFTETLVPLNISRQNITNFEAEIKQITITVHEENIKMNYTRIAAAIITCLIIYFLLYGCGCEKLKGIIEREGQALLQEANKISSEIL